MKTQWNTGALYTDEGQIIVAELLADRIIFRDFSRMIWGAINLPKYMTIRTPYALREYVDSAYLHNRYRYDAEAAKLRRND